ncbi:MAG: hypothetical protein ACKOED_10310 [Aestuariivirga sp.]|uniref:hypothetical protein n=1 Tax=Aestuariivirga sp. TaxID=2650926 RepID=UPI0038D0B2DF
MQDYSFPEDPTTTLDLAAADMAEGLCMSKQSPRSRLLLVILGIIICSLPIVWVVYVPIVVWWYSISPADSVRLAELEIDRRLRETGEQEKMQYAVCRYNLATPEEPHEWVGCRIDITASDEMIYFEMVLDGTGRKSYSDFDRVKR